MFLFAAEGLFTQEQDCAGYELLKCVRAYLNVMMYSGLHVQTASTMAAGRASIRVLHSLLSNYVDLPKPDEIEEKNWDFIKNHYLTHLFDDIQRKGVLRNFSTRLFEKQHGTLRNIYHRRTNFKNIAPQILEVRHQLDVSMIIKAEIELMEEYEKFLKSDSEEAQPKDTEDVFSKLGGAHFSIGSKLRAITLEDFGNEKFTTPEDVRKFRIELGNFMSKSLQAHGIRLPNERWINYGPMETILPFQFLKVNYESLETWQVSTDYLRCNPDFHKRPRYDFIIFNTEAGPVFAELKHLFVCTVGADKYPIAYVQPFKVFSMTRRRYSDRHLGILRIKPDTHCEFISVHSIVRGALCAAAHGAAGTEAHFEKLVVDTVDYDMFLRVKLNWPKYTDVD
ncbi:hypothetical protein V5O48_009650 [Marasmius crinis-equi]|uniref:Uncharacterized protein n=1 Tax=Marasmius crinis-equi TaxID=585013 RepID=A0ABR3FAI1_9AGAR